jgi:hypothetical protein
MHALTRTLVAALAILALAAPVASARIDPPPSGPTQSERAQDLAHLEAGGVTTKPRPAGVYWSYDYQAAKPAAHPGGVYWAYDYQAPKPAAHPAVPASVPATTPDDGTPWLTLGFAIAGACLLVSGAAVAVSLSRRPRGAGIA